MQFLMIYTPEPNTEAAAPPSPEKLVALGKFSQEMAESGVLVATGGILPSSRGARLRLSNGKFTTTEGGGRHIVTDGPYPETKELIAGYAIVRVNSKEEAIEVAKRFMTVAGDGEGEVRELMVGEI